MTVRRPALRCSAPSERVTGQEIAVRIQKVLASRGLTLSDVARESRLRYGQNRAYLVPHHFYADLRSKTFSPRIEQVLAFSAITNYRLVDWLVLFGFNLDDLSGLAATLPTNRTILLDSTVYDEHTAIRWLRSKAVRESRVTAPLGHFLEAGPLQLLKTLIPPVPSPFLYAKVGRNDAFAFPDLLPGSIVRIDTRFSRRDLRNTAASQSLFLVEHGRGLTACRLHLSGSNSITLRSTELPYAEVALQLGSHVRVIGKLDFEFRFLGAAPPGVARDLAIFWNSQPLGRFSPTPGFAEFAKRARDRARLSLREASARSRLIAEALGDSGYFSARAALSAYEKTGKPPRGIHKLLGLCSLYSLSFWDVLRAAVRKPEGLGTEPIPPALLGFLSVLPRDDTPRRAVDFGNDDFLSLICKEVQEIPFFLRNSIGSFTGLEEISVRDIVWLGERRPSLHPYLQSSILAVVNRRQRRPPSIGKARLWQEPIYLVLRRDGSYLCARCTLHGKVLVIHPFADGLEEPLRLRNGVAAEVVGRIAAVVRRL